MILFSLALAVSAIADPVPAGPAKDVVLVCYVRDANIVKAAAGLSAVPVGPHKLVVFQFPSLVNGSVGGSQAKLHDPNATFEGRAIKAVDYQEGAITITTEDSASGRLSMIMDRLDKGDSIRKASISRMSGAETAKMLVGHCTKDPLLNTNRAFRKWQSKPATVKS
jgi:hypothetical protein